MRSRARTITLATAVSVVLCVPPAISMAATTNGDVLLSRGRPTIASSVAGGTTAAAATDPGGDTRWVSADGPGTQWLRIDLEAVRRIDRVRLRWATEYARAYRVQSSTDGADWTDLYVTRAGDGGTDDLKRLAGQGRFLRVLATQRGRDDGGYSLWDVRAFGPDGAAAQQAAAPVAGPLPGGLADHRTKEIALELLSSAENSTLSWRDSYGYIRDLADGRGYTAGIVGFCSGTSDMLAVVTEYTRSRPGNALAGYLPALRTVDGSDSHAGLDPGFPAAWRAAAADPVFQKIQEDARDRLYFDPAVRLARADGLRALGQFAYFDAAVMHGVSGLDGIRQRAVRLARTPAQGGDEVAYLDAFLNARVSEMRTEEAHRDTSRVDTAQRLFLRRGNLDLSTPLSWSVYGDPFRITA